jgi:hypothetical protein
MSVCAAAVPVPPPTANTRATRATAAVALRSNRCCSPVLSAFPIINYTPGLALSNLIKKKQPIIYNYRIDTRECARSFILKIHKKGDDDIGSKTVGFLAAFVGSGG